MSKQKVCCSSRASICYWLIVSLAAWAGLAIIGEYWHPLRASSAVTCLLAMAVGCFANALKNRTYHCMLTGPLFLIAAILLLSSNLTHVKPNLNLDRRSRWNRNSVLAGMALCRLSANTTADAGADCS
jgi:hypothetical protein